MVLTRILRSANSAAQVRPSERMAALDAAYELTSLIREPYSAAQLDRTITVPEPRATNARAS